MLYKNGVGYFEHLGRVRGNQDIHIDFTSGQLNDALASLTVLDLDERPHQRVSYNSTAPLDKRLERLRLPLGTEVPQGIFRLARLACGSSQRPHFPRRLLSVETKD